MSTCCKFCSLQRSVLVWAFSKRCFSPQIMAPGNPQQCSLAPFPSRNCPHFESIKGTEKYASYKIILRRICFPRSSKSRARLVRFSIVYGFPILPSFTLLYLLFWLNFRHQLFDVQFATTFHITCIVVSFVQVMAADLLPIIIYSNTTETHPIISWVSSEVPFQALLLSSHSYGIG